MKYLNYILIVFGAFIAMYAKAGVNKNQYLLMGGIICLVIGVYRISKTIPSKHDKENNDDFENN